MVRARVGAGGRRVIVLTNFCRALLKRTRYNDNNSETYEVGGVNHVLL